MPKRVGYLYEKMCDRDVIKQTIIDGTRGKRTRCDVVDVWNHIDEYTERMYQMLMEGSYVPTEPRKRVIHDVSSGKERVIQIVPYFPDGLIHQLCVYAMKDVLMRGMYEWSCASIPGRGNKYAADYVKRRLRNDPKGTKYCLKMDIRRYYPSVDRSLLIAELERKIKDKRFLTLVRDIVFSGGEGGLAIGFYINQWLANYYLERLDHYILGLRGVKYYVRNMDDMVLLGSNKKDLHKARERIQHFLAREYHLNLKSDWQVYPVDDRGIDFVGYRFFHGYTILRKRNFLRLKRQSTQLRKKQAQKKLISYRSAAGIVSRIGLLKHCDSRVVRNRYLARLNYPHLLHIIRQHSIRQNYIKEATYG